MKQNSISATLPTQPESKTLSERLPGVLCPVCSRRTTAALLRARSIFGRYRKGFCNGCGISKDSPLYRPEKLPDEPQDAKCVPCDTLSIRDAVERQNASEGLGVFAERVEQDSGATGVNHTVLDNGVKIVPKSQVPTPSRTYDDLIEDGEISSRLANIDRRHRTGNWIADRLDEIGFTHDGKKVRKCSTHITLRKYLEGGQIQVSAANWCQKRILCPNCEKARSSRTIGQWVPKLVETIADTGTIPMFLTLTVRNGESLMERVSHMWASFGKACMARKNSLRGKTTRLEAFPAIEGGIFHCEIKRGKNSGLWHPHLHGLVLVHPDRLFNSDQLAGDWQFCTGDSFQVDSQVTRFGIEILRSGSDAREMFKVHRDLLLGDLCEVLKYCIKFDSNGSADDIIEAHYTLKGSHLSRTVGCLRGLKPVDKLTREEALGSGEYLDYVLKWSNFEDAYALRGVHRNHTDND